MNRYLAVVATIACAAAAVLAFLAFAPDSSPKPTPLEQRTLAFFAAVNAADWKAACAMTDPSVWQGLQIQILLAEGRVVSVVTICTQYLPGAFQDEQGQAQQFDVEILGSGSDASVGNYYVLLAASANGEKPRTSAFVWRLGRYGKPTAKCDGKPCPPARYYLASIA